MLLQTSPAAQLGAESSQYCRHTPVKDPSATHPEPGAQRADGLQAASGGVVPAGRHITSAGLS